MYEYRLEIHGMMCGMCESHINDAIRNNFDVKKVTSDRRKDETVILSKEKLDENKLLEVIKATGYDYKGMQVNEVEEKGFFSKLFKK